MLLEEYIEETIESEEIPGLGGTADCVKVYIQNDYGLVLHVIDLKYGAGVAVPVEQNPQLLAYLLLWQEKLASRYKVFDTYRATIYQPRTSGEAEDTVDYSHDELMAFKQELLAAIDESRANEFQAGDWCRWCPAVAHCDHLHQVSLEAAMASFAQGDIDRWCELKRVKPAIDRLLKEVDGKLLGEIRKGNTVPGYKAVEGLGHSAWIDEEEALKQLARRKVGKKIATINKLKSPTQLRNEGYEAEIDGLYHRPKLGPKLVPVSDKRPAISFETAAEQFERLARSNEHE